MKDLGLLFTYLQQPRRIVLLTHVRPDGDAVGSALSLKLYFEKKGHIADVIIPDDFPDFLNWMSQSDKCFNHQKNPKTCFSVLTRADCIFFLDFNAIKRIEALGEDVQKLNRPYVSVMIDHHREPDPVAARQDDGRPGDVRAGAQRCGRRPHLRPCPECGRDRPVDGAGVRLQR